MGEDFSFFQVQLNIFFVVYLELSLVMNIFKGREYELVYNIDF